MTDTHTIEALDLTRDYNARSFHITDASPDVSKIYEKHGFETVRVITDKTIHNTSINHTLVEITYEMGDPCYSATVRTASRESKTVYTGDFLHEIMKEHDLPDFHSAMFHAGGEYALEVINKKEWS